jgi:DNA-binding NtrC family response regulator
MPIRAVVRFLNHAPLSMTPGQGSSTRQTIAPASARVEPRDFPLMAKKSPSGRVLVVDDEPLIRWSVAETLGDRGYRVVEAEDGRSALEAAEEAGDPFDVVLLDFRLPDSNDLGLLARLLVLMPGSRIILMTAFSTPEITRQAFDLGAYSVVRKPFEIAEIASLVLDAHGSRA